MQGLLISYIENRAFSKTIDNEYSDDGLPDDQSFQHAAY